jgi:hypothetical protein
MEPGKRSQFPKKVRVLWEKLLSLWTTSPIDRTLQLLFECSSGVHQQRKSRKKKTIWIGWRLERIKELKGSLVGNTVSPIALDKPIDSTSFSLSNIISQVSLLVFWCQKKLRNEFQIFEWTNLLDVAIHLKFQGNSTVRSASRFKRQFHPFFFLRSF